MKKKISALALACFMVLVSLPLSALAKEAVNLDSEDTAMETEITRVPETPEQLVGNQVKNPPELFAVNAMGISRILALYDNGELWMVSDEMVEKITDNVKKCETMKNVRYGTARACFLLEDKDNALWTLEIGEDGVSQLSKRVENVVKYQGNYLSTSYNNYALDAAQNFWRLGADNQNLLNDVKDFVFLKTGKWRWDGVVAVLKNDGELLVLADSPADIGKGQFVTLETGVDSLVQKDVPEGNYFGGFIKNNTLYSCDLNEDTGRIEAVQKGEGMKAFYEWMNGKKVLFVRSDGSTWVKDMETASAFKVSDTGLKACETGFATGFDSGCIYLQDEEDNLYRWAMGSEASAQKAAERVKNFYGGVCLTEDGTLYQMSETDKEIVYTDVEQVFAAYPRANAAPPSTRDIYLIKKDHVLYRNKTVLLTDVADIIWDVNRESTGLYGIFITRLDGTIWYSSAEKDGDPAPYKLADYQAEIPVTGVKLSQSTLTLTQGYTAQLQAAIEPENATNQNVTWTSSHPDIASVENGLVAGVKEGEAVITATTEDGGKTAECKVTVKKAAPVLNPPDIASVENGLVAGVKEGEAVITATTEDGGKTAECKVTVKKAAPVLNPDSGTAEGITAGETGQAFADKLKDSGAIEDKNQIKLYKADGQEVSLDTKLATGMKVVVTIGQKMFNRNVGTQEYTVIVLGDISGDGIINIMDMLAAQDDILGKEKLEGCYWTAGDITKDSNINIMDMLAIQDDILGKEKINPYV